MGIFSSTIDGDCENMTGVLTLTKVWMNKIPSITLKLQYVTLLCKLLSVLAHLNFGPCGLMSGRCGVWHASCSVQCAV